MTYNKIKQKVLSNFSFLILASGAASNFLLILFIKNTYQISDFNSYSLFLTYIGIVSSFGLIGLDQVFLRVTKVTNNKIIVNSDVWRSLLVSSICIPLLLSFYFHSKGQNILLYQFIISGIGINIIIFSYNLLRLTKEFNLAQIIKNGFRIVLLIVIAIFTLINFPIGMGKLLDVLTLLIFVSAISALVHSYSKIERLKERTINFLNFFLSFSLNLAILTLLSFGERIFILDNIGDNEFGKYFYYSTIFLFPLTLIQQYVGFKELVGFKEGVRKDVVNRKIQKIIYLGFFIILFIYILSIIDNGRYLDVDFSNDILLISLLTILGLMKLIYGLFSAILGAIGNSKDIFSINIITITLIGLALIILYLSKITLEAVTASLIVVFFLRSLYIYIKYVLSPKY
ncbi:hypothetical protein [Arenibacter latericius]|uniref:hypothetical protein n=1 Tax=Arenibacter latericius TaxID=86104 RepID=UPI000409EC41|nr:hypothetical protein [Arenibacter latericius]